MTSKAKTRPDHGSGTTAALIAELDDLARRHYDDTDLTRLLAKVDAPLGRRQFSRLIGVMVKAPFARERRRRPSKSTRAVLALDWKDDASLRQIAPGTWQFDFMRALMSEEQGFSVTESNAYSLLRYYKYESTLGKFIFQAFRTRICGDPTTSKTVRAALAAAKRSGVRLIDPTTAHISVGLASTVAVAVASTLPPTIAAVGAPVGTVKLTAKLPKRPDRMGNVSRLGVLNSLGKLVQHERKAVTQHQSGGYGNARSLT